MYAVIRETIYSSDKPLAARVEFAKFQETHATQPGYRGTIVTYLGAGRYITVTLWETSEAMNAARKAIGPTVQKLIAPHLQEPSKLYGTGVVAYMDVAPVNQEKPKKPR